MVGQLRLRIPALLTQHPAVVERFRFTELIADVAVDAQGPLMGLGGRARIVAGRPPRDPQIVVRHLTRMAGPDEGTDRTT